MRKGRSQRKTRGSLSPASKRPPARANAGAAGGPQVVVGLTPPRSEESVETRSETRAAEAQRIELVREKSLEIVRESLELVRESLELHEHDEGAQAPESEEPVTVRPGETVNAEAIDAPMNAADAADVLEPTPLEATPLEATPARSLTLPTPDEMSIPPVGDLSVEPIAERFFSEGELGAAHNVHDHEEHDEWDQRAHKSVRKSLPEVVQRRARFAKYVRWAVGGAAVVCLAALARTALPPSASSLAAGASASRASVESVDAREGLEAREAPVAKAAAAAAVAVVEPVKAPESVAAPVVAVPAVAEAPAPSEPAKAADPEPAKAAEPTPAAAPAPVAAAAAADAKTALQEKNDSRRALERGKVGDAIAAGERSVALDPSDGEAWLLLGAAYQEKGNNAEARRCYSSCIKEGKRGPIGECRAMVR